MTPDPCGASGSAAEASGTEAAVTDREGEPITFDGCDCDLDDPCADAACQMRRDLDMRHAFASYRAAPPSRDDIDRMTYVEIMVDAGRAHLLTPEQRGAF